MTGGGLRVGDWALPLSAARQKLRQTDASPAPPPRACQIMSAIYHPHFIPHLMRRLLSVYRLSEMPIHSFGQSVSAARESGRQVECPYRVVGKASALSAGSDTPKSAYSVLWHGGQQLLGPTAADAASCSTTSNGSPLP